jgi:hypothetical protein
MPQAIASTVAMPKPSLRLISTCTSSAGIQLVHGCDKTGKNGPRQYAEALGLRAQLRFRRPAAGQHRCNSGKRKRKAAKSRSSKSGPLLRRQPRHRADHQRMLRQLQPLPRLQAHRQRGLEQVDIDAVWNHGQPRPRRDVGLVSQLKVLHGRCRHRKMPRTPLNACLSRSCQPVCCGGGNALCTLTTAGKPQCCASHSMDAP